MNDDRRYQRPTRSCRNLNVCNAISTLENLQENGRKCHTELDKDFRNLALNTSNETGDGINTKYPTSITAYFSGKSTANVLKRTKTEDHLKTENCTNKSKPSNKPAIPSENFKKPQSLPGRQIEFKTIVESVSEFIKTKIGTCLYISGVPGTGKTATVRLSLEYIQWMAKQEHHSKVFDPIQIIWINGMHLCEPVQTYSIMWQALEKMNQANLANSECTDSLESAGATCKKTGTSKILGGNIALKRLTEYFRKDDKKVCCIVVLDELDLLLKRRHSILYHFFEWTGWPNSNLTVIAIANMMDLPERYLPNRIASRMGLHRLNFRPYQHNELQTIIKDTLTNEGLVIDIEFKADALEYCARKVSSISGDARRAISYCRRALAWISANLDFSKVPSTKKELISIATVNQALQGTLVGYTVEKIRNCLSNEIFLLLSILLANERSSEVINSFELVNIDNLQTILKMSFRLLIIVSNSVELMK